MFTFFRKFRFFFQKNNFCREKNNLIKMDKQLKREYERSFVNSVNIFDFFELVQPILRIDSKRSIDK
jgi:hypothetical protein